MHFPCPSKSPSKQDQQTLLLAEDRGYLIQETTPTAPIAIDGSVNASSPASTAIP